MFRQQLQKKSRKEKRQKEEKQKYSSRKDSTSQQSRSLIRNPNYLRDCSLCESHSILVEISFLLPSIAKEIRLDSRPPSRKDSSCGHFMICKNSRECFIFSISNIQLYVCIFFFFSDVQIKRNISKIKIELSCTSRSNTWFGLGHPFLCSRCDQSFTTFFPSSLVIVLLTALLACVWPSLLWHLLLTNGNNLTKEPIKTWEHQLWTNNLRRNPFIFSIFYQINKIFKFIYP